MNGGLVSADEVNAIARHVVENCDAEASKELHSALCELLQSRGAKTFDGVMALLWTAVHATKLMGKRDDGVVLDNKGAERVLCAIMRGPEPVLRVNAAGGAS